jgi:antitoxin component YwqK of YwqJK toxin-antitoxin module
MVTQKITYYPNTYIMHEFFEYDDNQLILYERYDLNEKLEYCKSPYMECHYLNGQPHGISKAWYENGQLWMEHNYINGKAQGIQKAWFINGQIAYEQDWNLSKIQ